MTTPTVTHLTTMPHHRPDDTPLVCHTGLFGLAQQFPSGLGERGWWQRNGMAR